jgi:phosphonate transport system substrate-binding protein
VTTLRIIGPWFCFTFFFLFTFSRTALAETLHIGSIGRSPADEIKDFLPLVRHLKESLKGDGIEDVKVVVNGSIQEMSSAMRTGKVDLYIDSAFPSMALAQLAGSKFLVRRWKRGIGEYRSVIFARKESALSKLSDLKGRIIAFEEPYSSSGYFFPKLALVQTGLKLVAKKEVSDVVAAAEIGYVFSDADENTMLWVVRNKVIAGATDHQTYVKQARAHIKDLAIVHESAPIPRHILSYRHGLADKLVAKIQDILLAMDRSEAGKMALLEFQQTAKFDPIPIEFTELVSKSASFVRQELGLK